MHSMVDMPYVYVCMHARSLFAATCLMYTHTHARRSKYSRHTTKVTAIYQCNAAKLSHVHRQAAAASAIFTCVFNN